MISPVACLGGLQRFASPLVRSWSLPTAPIDRVDLSPGAPLLSGRQALTLSAGALAASAAVGFAASGLAGAALGVGCVGALGLLGIAATATAVVSYGRRDDRRATDCIVVLGTSARPDGMPGPALEARVRHAESLYRSGVASSIILTGGRGTAGRAESDAARRLAIADGIPASALLQETSSENTWENFARAREIMKAHGWTTCVVSTDPYHARRSIDIAGDMGITAFSSPASESPRHGAHALWRECVSTWKYWNYRLGREVRTPRPA